MTGIKLEACPFCGSAAALRSGDHWYSVECDDPTYTCCAHGSDHATAEYAIAAWNRRAVSEHVEPAPEAGGVVPWAKAAMEALEAYEADYGDKLPDDHELGLIEDSRGSPSFRIRVGHIRSLSASPPPPSDPVVQKLVEALRTIRQNGEDMTWSSTDYAAGLKDQASIARAALALVGEVN